MNGEAGILVRNLKKRYGSNEVLRGVSFHVPRGRTLALLGRNGAGKSTIIRTLMGLQPGDGGTVRVCGLDPERDAMELRRRTGFLAEDQQMFGWMTVAQLVSFVSAFYPTWDDALATHFLDQFQLSTNVKVKHLSKGQNIRLGLLLVLAHKPEVVILDDPCLALDPIMRSEFNRELVTHLQGRGSTVLYSSHLLAEVEAVADSVAILHGGRIVRHADVDELRSDVKRLIVPLQEFTLVADRLRLLDVRVNGPEVAAIVDDCGSALRLFAIEGVEARTDDLTLDEIFAAFVTGRAEFETLAPAVKSAPEGGVP